MSVLVDGGSNDDGHGSGGSVDVDVDGVDGSSASTSTTTTTAATGGLRGGNGGEGGGGSGVVMVKLEDFGKWSGVSSFVTPPGAER